MIEVRDAGPGYWALTGMATTWATAGKPYFVTGPEGTFYEQFERNAFADATGGHQPVELLRDHDWDHSPVYAATANKTMALTDEDRGVLLAAALSKDITANQDIIASVKSGERRGLSVAFKALDERWTTAPDGRTATRSVSRASLREVSICRSPVNPGAHNLSVRGTETRSADGWEFRHFPLTYRQDATGNLAIGIHDDDADDEPCPTCDGSGLVGSDRRRCPTCGGSGSIDDDDADDQPAAEGRRDFSDAERAQLGKQGKAVWIDGHWAYPTPTRSDFDNAVRALGRTPGKNRATVRRYLVRRARSEGWPIPASWRPDGTTEGREALVERLALERIQDQRDEEFLLADFR